MLLKIIKFEMSILINRRKGQELKMIEKLFAKTKIAACNWKDAITKTAQPLLQAGGIKKTYIDKMIKNIIEHGPYIVIMPGIALAHARPEDGVNYQCISLATLKDPIEFGNKNNDPVKLLIVLAAVNNNDHIVILKKLMKIVTDEEKYNAVINCKSDKELRDFVNSELGI